MHAAWARGRELVDLVGDDVALVVEVRGDGVGEAEGGVLLGRAEVLALLPLAHAVARVGGDERVARRVVDGDAERERLTGEIPEKGKKVTLRVKNPEDLARDILKSESCALECPELSLTVNPGTLGGRFTTVEGLLTQVRDDLHNQIFEADADAEATARKPDSLSDDEKTRWEAFFDKLNKAVKGEIEFTIVLTDPLASSYVQSLADDPSQPDEQMTVEEYERTDEEEEDLGLKDMKTEGYEEDA